MASIVAIFRFSEEQPQIILASLPIPSQRSLKVGPVTLDRVRGLTFKVVEGFAVIYHYMMPA